MIRSKEALTDRPLLSVVGAETPLQATRMVLDEIKKMDAATERRVAALSNDLRKEVISRMAQAENFEAFRLPRLMGDLELTFAEWELQYKAVQSDALGRAADLGEELVDAPVRAAGASIELPRTSVSMLQTSQKFSADLIKEIASDVRREINREVILASNGVQTPFETFKKVEQLIDDPLTFRSIRARSLTIAKTEGGRIQSMASQLRQERAARIVQGLKKQWKWSGTSRPQHAAVNNQVRAVDEPFDIPAYGRCPEDRLMFPRDPAGLACQTINCGCQSVPYKEDWKTDTVEVP